MKAPLVVSVSVLALGLAIGLAVYLGKTPVKRGAATSPARVTLPGDPYYSTDRPVAKAKYQEFVKANETSPDKNIQDEVSRARIKLAYLQTKDHDFEGARGTLKEAEAKYAGEGLMTADFGGLKDGAAYEAIACLMAEHQNAQAEKELRRFMVDYKFSPLVRGAFQRLRRLHSGKIDPHDDLLLQQAVAAQQKKIQEETAMCGPKCIAKLLELTGHVQTLPDYKAIAKLCGTTDKGTTMEGMKKGLKDCGVSAYGIQVNRRDFEKIPLPAILLSGQHYVLITSISASAASDYDPALGRTDTIPLPALDNAEFAANLLVSSIPDFDLAGPASVPAAKSSSSSPRK